MDRDLRKEYLHYPTLPTVSRARKLVHKVLGLALFPLYWAAGYVVRTPGMAFRRYCAFMGIRLLLSGEDIRVPYGLIVSPMDSVRHFEFDFMWRAIQEVKIQSYLDISSPRLFPLVVVDRNRQLRADLLNPDKKDLLGTISLAKYLGITERCRFHSDLIQSVPLTPNSFDAVTSISVIEHIPDDTEVLRKIWGLLRPGGKLLISVPCAATASEEYMSVNEYGLISADENGMVFWQRYYDEQLLRERVFCVTGEPSRFLIYGEKKAGNYAQNMTRKRTDPLYPYWREPFMMGQEYEYVSRLSALPGIGVIGMEFVK